MPISALPYISAYIYLCLTNLCVTNLTYPLERVHATIKEKTEQKHFKVVHRQHYLQYKGMLQVGELAQNRGKFQESSGKGV